MGDLMRIKGFSIELALGGWPAITLGSPEAATVRSNITLHQQQEGQAARSRSFTVLPNPYGEAYNRSFSDAMHEFSAGDNQALLNTRLDTEQLAPWELPRQGATPCHYSIDAELGHDVGGSTLCPVLPTRLNVARRALAHVGLTLVVYPGPGLPFLNDPVEYGYTTKGKTVQQVLSDTLLETNPRVWMEDTIVHVDGRALLEGGPSGIGHVLSYSWSLQPGYSEAVPEREKLPEEEACALGFEQLDDAEYSWSETTGNADDYSLTTVTYTIRKASGQLALEREQRWGYVNTWSGYRWHQIYDALTEREFHAICPQAMVKETEVVRAVNLDTIYANLMIHPGATALGKVTEIKDFQPPLVEMNRKTVTQTWHAEGWLKSRVEVKQELAAWAQLLLAGDFEPGYKRTVRSEFNLPTGDGMWMTRVVEQIPVDVPVYEPVSEGSQAFTMTYPVAYTNAYTRLTDQAPPSVSCEAADDPCAPVLTDAARVERDYQHALKVHAAKQVMSPLLRVHALTLPGLQLHLTRGEFQHGCFVARVAFVGEANDARTEVELWEKLPS
jgi:hypothetical protein